MSDLKTSLLVNRQVPEFVRDEYPKFISFLEAYYEFLEQTTGVTKKSKELRYITDVDESLDEFEKQFFNTFLPFIPRDVAIDKELLIKNILPLYLSKGSEKSFRLLFRMLFGEEITIDVPSRQILKASDGKWTVENFLRVELGVYSDYISDGQKTTYYLPSQTTSDKISIYLNGSLSTNYEFRKEYKKIVFNSAPSVNTAIRITYDDFNGDVLNSTKIYGLESGAYAIIEKVGRRNIGGTVFYQFFIDRKTIFGNFKNGELLRVDFIDDNKNAIPLTFQSFSDLLEIKIIEGGSKYNIGDPVIIRGTSTKQAVAVVDQIVSGTIDNLIINDGGSGFKVQNNVLIDGVNTSIFFSTVSGVDDSGVSTPNTLSYNIDVISNYLSLNISDPDYGFPANVVPSENVNTVISSALTSNTITGLGSITLINVETSLITSQSQPQFVAYSSKIFGNTTIGDLGIIGRIDIINPGVNYNVGDYLTFTNNLSFSGQNANAYVSAITTNGSIAKVQIVNGGLGYDLLYPPTITVNSANGSNAVLEIGSIMGRTIDVSAESFSGILGEILAIKILESGEGYKVEPGIDLSRSGDGKAVAEPVIRGSLVELPGRWTAPDGLISNEEIRIQGLNYYINYSYVINSKVEFGKYKSLFKNLIHPAGFIDYARYLISKNIESQSTLNVRSSLIKTVSGTVNISSNSNTIIGINSNFTTAQTLGIIQTGNTIAIGNSTAQILSINSSNLIIVTNVTTYTSNSNTISNVFTFSSNNQIIKILT